MLNLFRLRKTIVVPASFNIKISSLVIYEYKKKIIRLLTKNYNICGRNISQKTKCSWSFVVEVIKEADRNMKRKKWRL